VVSISDGQDELKKVTNPPKEKKIENATVTLEEEEHGCRQCAAPTPNSERDHESVRTAQQNVMG
jgi:hypothetical protein